MTEITLQSIHKDLVEVKRELIHLKILLQEEFEIADDVAADIGASRVRPAAEMISHEELRKEFG